MAGPTPEICDYEGSDYQDRFWEQGGRAYEDGAEAVALKTLLPAGGEHLLEIGAGAGRNTGRYPGFRRITLLDYSRTQLEQARARLGDAPRYRYIAADVYRMPFGPGQFDAATMIRTLHHLQQPEAALLRVRETLRPGSAFILEYANKRNLKAIVRWALARQDWSPFDWTPVEFARLNYDFHPAAVRAWAAAAMFHVEREIPVSHLRLGWLKRHVPTRALLAVEAALQRLGRLWLYTPSVFLRARATGPAATAASPWRCPACRSLEVREDEHGVACGDCGRVWEKRDGIYDFRPKESG
jgi:SAM-dependent methyltransferase